MSAQSANATVEDVMHALVRGLEWSSMVADWCLAERGCQDVPCSCASLFEPPDFDGDEPIELRAARPAQLPGFPAPTLVWTNPTR